MTEALNNLIALNVFIYIKYVLFHRIQFEETYLRFAIPFTFISATTSRI